VGSAAAREGVAGAKGMAGAWVGRLPVAPQGAAKDAGRIKLVTAELRHQAAARPLKEPPADQIFEGGSRLAVPRQLEVLIAVLLGFDIGVEKPGLPLGDLLVEQVFLGRI